MGGPAGQILPSPYVCAPVDSRSVYIECFACLHIKQFTIAVTRDGKSPLLFQTPPVYLEWLLLDYLFLDILI